MSEWATPAQPVRETDLPFAVETKAPGVSSEHERRALVLADEIGCALLYIRKDQAKTITQYAKRAGIKPNQWIINALNAYAQAQDRVTFADSGSPPAVPGEQNKTKNDGWENETIPF